MQPRSYAGVPAGNALNFSRTLSLIPAGPDTASGNASALGLATLGSADGKPQAFSAGAGLLGSSGPSPVQDAAASSSSLKVTLDIGNAPAIEGSSPTPGDCTRHFCLFCCLMMSRTGSCSQQQVYCASSAAEVVCTLHVAKASKHQCQICSAGAEALAWLCRQHSTAYGTAVHWIREQEQTAALLPAVLNAQPGHLRRTAQLRSMLGVAQLTASPGRAVLERQHLPRLSKQQSTAAASKPSLWTKLGLADEEQADSSPLVYDARFHGPASASRE